MHCVERGSSQTNAILADLKSPKLHQAPTLQTTPGIFSNYFTSLNGGMAWGHPVISTHGNFRQPSHFGQQSFDLRQSFP